MKTTTTVTFRRSRRSKRESTTSQSLGMMIPTSTAGPSKSSTLLGMNPECSKSAPSPLSSLNTEVKFQFFYFFLSGLFALDFGFLFFLLVFFRKVLARGLAIC